MAFTKLGLDWTKPNDETAPQCIRRALLGREVQTAGGDAVLVGRVTRVYEALGCAVDTIRQINRDREAQATIWSRNRIGGSPGLCCLARMRLCSLPTQFRRGAVRARGKRVRV